MENGYIPSKNNYATCYDTPCRLTVKKQKYVWQCSKCTNCTSIYKGTVYYKSKLKITKLIDLIYFWSIDLKQKNVRYEIETKSRQTTTTWYKNLRNLSQEMAFELNDQKIGGVGHIVEIDESLFSRRK